MSRPESAGLVMVVSRFHEGSAWVWTLCDDRFEPASDTVAAATRGERHPMAESVGSWETADSACKDARKFLKRMGLTAQFAVHHAAWTPVLGSPGPARRIRRSV